MIFSSRKNKVVMSYLTTLPKLMTKDYGKSSEYTMLQVIKSIERYKLNTKYQDYALVLFCNKEEFLIHYKNQEVESYYTEIKDEISKKYFDGSDFNSTDVSKYSKLFSGYAYEDPGDGDGGGALPTCGGGDGGD